MNSRRQDEQIAIPENLVDAVWLIAAIVERMILRGIVPLLGSS